MPSLDSIITFSTLAALVQLGIIISVILRVMLTRHPPGSSFAWILITTLLPYFGFILYLLFGERPIGQIRATRFRKHLAHLKELSHQKLTPTGPLPRHLARHRTLIHLATRMGNLPVTSGTEIRLLSSSDDTFAAIISDIEAARSSIDMEFYIWHPGGEADKVAASRRLRLARLPQERHLQGVPQCRDRSRQGHAHAAPALLRPSARRPAPPPQDHRHRQRDRLHGQPEHDRPAHLRRRAHRRPLGRRHGPPHRPRRAEPARHLSDRLGHPARRRPSDLEWVHSVPPIPQLGTATIVTVPSGPYGHKDPNLYLLLDAINAARFNITITTPYFVPNEGLATALLSAAYRGVKIRLIVPANADSKAVTWAARRYFDDMLSAGVEVLLYNGGLLHTKSISVDDEYAVFGTVNFDNRSIHLNFEMMLLIFDAGFIQDIKKLHDSYAEQCSRLDPETWYRRPVSERLKEGACYLISPLL